MRLTAPDGYTAVRSYSIASAPDGSSRIDLTVERLHDGEVSPYLTTELLVGDLLELRGPLGCWFVWRVSQPQPIQLVAGGSGIVPLMAMIRTRVAADSSAPFRLLYSIRDPQAILYRDEMQALAPVVNVDYVYTREAPPSWPRRPGRIDAKVIADTTWPQSRRPTCYVCGPTGFVERAADLLTASGHRPDEIRTERFGPTGEHR